jgi:hypothetical protein
MRRTNFSSTGPQIGERHGLLLPRLNAAKKGLGALTGGSGGPNPWASQPASPPLPNEYRVAAN